MEQDKYRNYIRDLIYLLKEYRDKPNQNDPFQEGEKFGYSSIIDLIENQATAFSIDLDDIGFYDYENFKKRK